jgi:hypothetical protein
MNHRPFEDWLLDDQPLTPQQARDLHAHLRSCTYCASIAESNLALHTARMIAPAAGFTDRFKIRLVDWRRQQRWQQMAGTLVLVFGGLVLLYWLAGPVIQEAVRSPAAWITAAAGYLVFLLTSFRVLSEVSAILLHDLPSFIPPVGWLVVFLIGSGLGLTWIYALRRLVHVPQGG